MLLKIYVKSFLAYFDAKKLISRKMSATEKFLFLHCCEMEIFFVNSISSETSDFDSHWLSTLW